MSLKTLSKRGTYVCALFSFVKTFTINTFWYTQYSMEDRTREVGTLKMLFFDFLSKVSLKA